MKKPKRRTAVDIFCVLVLDNIFNLFKKQNKKNNTFFVQLFKNIFISVVKVIRSVFTNGTFKHITNNITLFNNRLFFYISASNDYFPCRQHTVFPIFVSDFQIELIQRL